MQKCSFSTAVVSLSSSPGGGEGVGRNPGKAESCSFLQIHLLMHHSYSLDPRRTRQSRAQVQHLEAPLFPGIGLGASIWVCCTCHRLSYCSVGEEHHLLENMLTTGEMTQSVWCPKPRVGDVKQTSFSGCLNMLKNGIPHFGDQGAESSFKCSLTFKCSLNVPLNVPYKMFPYINVPRK